MTFRPAPFWPSTALFAATALAFVLPFGTLVLDGRTATYTGFQLVLAVAHPLDRSPTERSKSAHP